jgi:hypothetical protein
MLKHLMDMGVSVCAVFCVVGHRFPGVEYGLAAAVGYFVKKGNFSPVVFLYKAGYAPSDRYRASINRRARDRPFPARWPRCPPRKNERARCYRLYGARPFRRSCCERYCPCRRRLFPSSIGFVVVAYIQQDDLHVG